MSFKDRMESPLNRIVSQVDGGRIREDFRDIPPQGVAYHQYGRMREQDTTRGMFRDESVGSRVDMGESFEDGFRPLRKRVHESTLQRRGSDELTEGSPLDAPLAGRKSLHARLPESNEEIKQRLLASRGLMTGDPSADIEAEIMRETQMEERKPLFSNSRSDAPQSEVRARMHEEFPRKKGPMDTGMRVANREGVSVVSESQDIPQVPRRRSPEKIELNERRRVDDVSVLDRSLGVPNDVASFLSGLSHQVRESSDEPERAPSPRMPSTDDAIHEEIERSVIRRADRKPLPESQASKTRRRVGPPIEEGLPIVEDNVDKDMSDLYAKLSSPDHQPGLGLVEDIVHDYVGTVYAGRRDLEPIEDTELDSLFSLGEEDPSNN